MTEKYEYCSTVPRAFVQDCRLVTMSRKSDHVTPLLFQLHWLPVDQRLEFKVLLFTYKAMQGLAPQYLSDLLEPYSPLRSLRSAAKLLPNSLSFYLRTYGYKSFSVCAPRLQDSLRVYIKSSSSVDILRKRLKTYLFVLFSINFCHSSELNALKAFDSPVPDLLGATSEYFQMEDRTIVLTKFRCKNYYSLFIEELASEPSAVAAWKKSFPEHPDWGDCYASIYKSTKDNLILRNVRTSSMSSLLLWGQGLQLNLRGLLQLTFFQRISPPQPRPYSNQRNSDSAQSLPLKYTRSSSLLLQTGHQERISYT